MGTAPRVQQTGGTTMDEHDAPDPQFDAMTARLLRREALRRAAEELNTMSGPGLETAFAQISAEVTAEAVWRKRGNAVGPMDLDASRPPPG